MLELDVKVAEVYDEVENKFVISKTHRVQLEHSLVTLSKWESFWKIPFLGKGEKSSEQTISYVKMMIVGDEPPPEVFQILLRENIGDVMSYIEDQMTATTIAELPSKGGGREVVTSELIYFWMSSMQIPAEFERWHLNRLITLIRVINAKNSPKRKMSVAERQALNQQRLAKYKTRG